MKKLLMAVLAMFACVTVASAKTSGIQDVQKKGHFNLSINLCGVPPAADADPNEWNGDVHIDHCFQNAKMPMMGVDGNWTLASGMFNAGKFGKNGAIDLGFYYGFCLYENAKNKEWGGMQNVGLVRCAFHFEFVPKFDVYAGMFSGVNVESPYGEDSKENGWGPYADFAMGPFIGCKYYFTDHFGLKAEFGDDFASCAFPNASFGLAFKF